ncbi:MAG: GNAT family N-acetyltransferase [Clostridia bacterium]|nr:GNAT family N-acetyltransferase [Clostridia bacterium]
MSMMTIRISDYLTHELAAESALGQWRSADLGWVNQIRGFNFDGKSESDFFHVIALDGDRLVGRLDCLQNEADPHLWYYGDLFVLPEYRRRGIASAMVRAAADEVWERGARVLRCYVEPRNTASMALQRKLGFDAQPWVPFGSLDNAGQEMFEFDLPSPYTVLPYAGIADPRFIMKLHRQCEAELHDRRVTLPEWREILAEEDPDEAHFLVCRGCVPVAWLKINGLCGAGTAWISTLAVGTRWRRQGVGRCAVEFALAYLRERGFSAVQVMTTADNAAARGLYTACGFSECVHTEGRTGDGEMRERVIFSRDSACSEKIF